MSDGPRRDQWGILRPPKRRSARRKEEFNARFGPNRYEDIESGRCEASDEEIAVLAEMLQINVPAKRKPEPNFERMFTDTGKGVNRHGIRRL